MIGSTALMTSEASVVSVAPCLIRSLVPAARGSSGEPGTANTSRPCSAAIRAVISDPERSAASTTTTPSAAPEISRLRLGKSRARRHMPERHFGNRGPAGIEDLCQQVFMLGRIDPVVAAGQHRHGAARKAGAMRRLIDAARQPRHDDEAGVGRDRAPGYLRISARRRRRCASRRPRASAASAHPARRARRASGGASSSVASRGG